MKHRFFNMRRECVLLVFIGISACASPSHAGAMESTEPLVLAAAGGTADHPDCVGLEEELRVTLRNGGKLIDEARRRNKNIILFLDRMPLKEVYPVSHTIHGETDELRFFIRHNDAPIALWNHFMASRGGGELFTRKVSISVGLEDSPEIPTLVKDDNSFALVLVSKTWFTICIAIIAALFVLFLVLAMKSDILREVGPSPDTGRKAYSLALVQMAIWFFVIITSWLLLYVVKHTFNTITDTLVILMGISAGTGMGGVVIDTGRERSVKQSRGFLKDILSDEYGISFHRFQIFAWTVVMVAVFIRQVTAYLVMPEFDSSLLVLMAISSGTYLGFKVTEKPGVTRA